MSIWSVLIFSFCVGFTTVVYINLLIHFSLFIGKNTTHILPNDYVYLSVWIPNYAEKLVKLLFFTDCWVVIWEISLLLNLWAIYCSIPHLFYCLMNWFFYFSNADVISWFLKKQLLIFVDPCFGSWFNVQLVKYEFNNDEIIFPNMTYSYFVFYC